MLVMHFCYIRVYHTVYKKTFMDYNHDYALSTIVYISRIHENMKTHGQSYRDSYDDYIERISGSMDLDRLEW